MTRMFKLTITAAVAACAGGVTACWEDGPLAPESPERAVSPLILADTSAAAVAGYASGAHASANARASGVTYVSLASGSVSNGMYAVISNRRTGATTSSAMTDGGMDPVTIEAQGGDTIETVVQIAGSSSSRIFREIVPPTRPPFVVRTMPPRSKVDVPLNAIITIIFSEPIDPASLTPSTVGVVRGTTPVPGRLRVADAEGLVVEFRPDVLLTPNASHQITVARGLRDRDGDGLTADVSVEFSTGTTVAVASVATEQPALFTARNGEIRTFEINAIQHDDQNFTGRYTIFYPGTGFRASGRITCFAIVDDRAIWMAGVMEEAGNPLAVGLEFGWRFVDNGATGAGLPDQLSMAYALQDFGLGTAREFCANQPTVGGIEGNELSMYPLERGNIVLRGTDGAPPVPPASDMSEIAFAAAPDGGIRAMRADGFGSRILTSSQGDWDPVWSPDGSTIAFARMPTHDEAGAGIYVINRDGSGLRRLTGPGHWDANPTWSPDGSRLAFYRDGAIHVMNANDGSGVTRLTDDGEHPAWSPDGTRIAFWSSADGRPGIYTITPTGSGRTRITRDTLNATNPAWSPDGRSIVFQGYGAEDGIFVMRADGSDVTRLAFDGQTPTWSPDSRLIIYEAYGLNLIAADGAGLRRLGPGFAPSWSPIGTMPPLPEPSVTMEKAAGDAQTDTVMAALPLPLTVRLVRAGGMPAAGVRVYWRITGVERMAADPVLSSGFTDSDAAGLASVSVTLGSVAAPMHVYAYVTDGSAMSTGVRFNATARAGNAVSLHSNGLVPALVLAGTDLRYAVYARDAHGTCDDPECGNLPTGLPISWRIESGGGSIAPAQDTTAFGRASEDEYDIPQSVAVHSATQDGISKVVATAPAGTDSLRLTFTSTVVTQIVGVDWYGFHADTVTVPAGKTVGWRWLDEDYTHDVTFEDVPSQPTSSPAQGYGSTFARTFTGGPRSVRYRCTLHSTSFTAGEVGVVIVQ